MLDKHVPTVITMLDVRLTGVDRFDSAISPPPTRSESNDKLQVPLLPALQEFRDFIEGNSRILTYFNPMWERENKMVYAGHTTVRDYEHMFEVLNAALQTAPKWT